MYAIFVIFLFYAAGLLLSKVIGGLIPGNVLGMLLLFGALLAGWVKPEKMRTVASFITTHMALYFVPVGVGLMVTTRYFAGATVAIVVGSAVSTVLVLVVTAWVQQILEKWKR